VSVALLSKKRECVRSVPIAAGYLASSRVQTFGDTKKTRFLRKDTRLYGNSLFICRYKLDTYTELKSK
jgi:hypothetical protein